MFYHLKPDLMFLSYFNWFFDVKEFLCELKVGGQVGKVWGKSLVMNVGFYKGVKG